jgi:hypothetical protein
MGHAWVETPLGSRGIVFDPSRQRFFDRGAYYRFLDIRSAPTCYTAKQALAFMLHTRVMGPWTAAERAGALGGHNMRLVGPTDWAGRVQK